MKTSSRSIFNIFTLFALLISLLGSVVNVTPARAATLTVTDCAKDNGGAGQLRTLMNAAVSGDTINIPACTITIEGASGDDANASGDLDFTKNLTITGAGAGSTIIQAGTIGYPGVPNGVDRVLHVTGAFTVRISNVTIRNGNTAALDGGGIQNFGGTLTVTNSIFSGNSAKIGGGINNLGTLTVTNSTFSGNSADVIAGGGGISNTGKLTATNSTFSGNVAGSGGGILSYGLLMMTNSTISGNSAGSGGGIYSTSATTLKNTIVAGNAGGNCIVGGGSITAGTDSMTDTSCGSATVKTLVQINLGALTGSPAYYPLGSGSAAIDAGTNTGCPTDSQNGVARPANSTCDIGSYETPAASGSSPIFADVPFEHWANSFVERLYKMHVTDGCGISPMIYCPDASATRAEMAIFILRAKYNTLFFSYMPPPAAGNVFSDVPLGAFADAWIEQLAKEGITTGCGGGGNYCPNAPITRAEMSVFLLRGKYGSAYNPPAATGNVFTDVPLASFAAAWIEQLAKEGITTGCGNGNYCPGNSVTRAEMAVFLVKAFNLP